MLKRVSEAIVGRIATWRPLSSSWQTQRSNSLSAHSNRLLELIRQGVDSESTTPTEEAKAQITLEAYPFPITKGCYVTIEQQYAGSLSEAENRSVDEALHIVTVVGVAAQLKSNKAFPVSIIPSIASLFPDWVCFRPFLYIRNSISFRPSLFSPQFPSATTFSTNAPSS